VGTGSGRKEGDAVARGNVLQFRKRVFIGRALLSCIAFVVCTILGHSVHTVRYGTEVECLSRLRGVVQNCELRGGVLLSLSCAFTDCVRANSSAPVVAVQVIY